MMPESTKVGGFAALILAVVGAVWAYRNKEKPSEKKTVTPHEKDYSNGPGLFGKHKGVYRWGSED